MHQVFHSDYQQGKASDSWREICKFTLVGLKVHFLFNNFPNTIIHCHTTSFQSSMFPPVIDRKTGQESSSVLTQNVSQPAKYKHPTCRTEFATLTPGVSYLLKPQGKLPFLLKLEIVLSLVVQHFE